MNKIVRQFGFYVALIGLWQIVAMLKIWKPYLFPTPWNVVEALRAGFADHTFWTGMAVSMKRMLIGYLLSCVMGIVLGIVLAQSRFLAETLGRLVVSIQSLPSVCWLPVAILWFGLTEKAIIFVVVIGSLLAVAIAVETGLRNVPRIYLMAGRNLGATRVDLLLHVFLPASLPHLMAGLKQGWAFAWRSLITGEMIFVSLGLGQLLTTGRDLNDINQVVAVMLLIVAIGALADGLLFRSVERIIEKKWGLATTNA